MKRLTTALAGIAALVLAVAAGIATAGSAAGPVTVKQCTGEKLNHTVTYDKVPEKVFVLDPQSAEFLIALGLGDRIVGTWGMFEEKQLKTILKQYAPQLRAIENYDDHKTWPPPVEQIAASGADFVATIYRINMPGYIDAKRMEKDLGIKTYSFASYCYGKVMRTFDPVYADIATLGRIFHVEDRASALIAKIKGQVDQAKRIMAGVPRRTIWTFGGDKIPYPIGGRGVQNAITWLAGAKNAFEDLPAAWGESSWEQVVKRNPEVVWLMPDGGAPITIAGIKTLLAKRDGIAAVSGFANKRYVELSYHLGGVLSVHNGEAVLSLARQLSKLPA